MVVLFIADFKNWLPAFEENDRTIHGEKPVANPPAKKTIVSGLNFGCANSTKNNKLKLTKIIYV